MKPVRHLTVCAANRVTICVWAFFTVGYLPETLVGEADLPKLTTVCLVLIYPLPIVPCVSFMVKALPSLLHRGFTQPEYARLRRVTSQGVLKSSPLLPAC